jgi:hypothetical protein
MKTHLLRNIFIVGSAALALAASTVVLPSVADAGTIIHQSGYSGQHNHMAYGAYGKSGRGAYGGAGYYGGYGGAYYPGYCGPIQLTLGLCGPWGY